MLLESLKKLVDQYNGTTIGDVTKVLTEMDFNNPAVLAGCVLIGLSLAGIGIYMLLVLMSALSYRKNSRISEDNSLYHLSSRISSLEMALAEYKNVIKHLNQQMAADKLSISSDINRLKLEIKNAAIENSAEFEFKRVA